MIIQYNKLGIMQGRLSPPYKNKIQHFPVDYWKNEFKLLKKFGMGCIEWVFEEPNINKNPLYYENQCSIIKKLAIEENVRINTVVADYFMVNKILDKNSERQKENIYTLKKLISHCNLVGIPIVELPFVDSSSLCNEQFVELVEVLDPICSHANKKGIKLSLETDLPPEEFMFLIELFVPNTVYVNYDMGNSASLGFNPLEEIQILGPHILNVHIKDRLLHGTTVPLGKGSVNFEKVFSTLKDADYQNDFILQTAREDINPNKVKKPAIRSIQEYINFLNPWIDRA